MEALSELVEGIKEAYRERQLNTEEQWPPVRGDKLINLQLVEAAKEEGFKAGLPQHGTPGDTVKRTPILHGDLFKIEESKKPVKKLIVEGNAGIGKTTLCTMLAEGWAEGKTLTQFNCVLLLPLRDQLVSSASSLPDLLALHHPDETICESVAQQLKKTRGKGVLIIADGWDELSEANRSKRSFLHSLLFGRLLPSASILLTSRPSVSAPLHNLPSVNRVVEVVGFNEESIKQYIESEFEQFPEKASSLIEQLENNPVIQSVCSVPLNCAIVCNLWHTLDQELPRTLTELYTQIVLNIILRNVKKKFPDCPISLNRFDEIPNDIQDVFWLTCEFAYECLLLDQLVFSKAELSSRLPEVGDKLQCFGLLQSARSLLPVGHGLSFHFAHLTIQEFLAALHLATLPNEEKLKIIEANADSGRFNMVWRFMFGLASKYNGSHSDKVISLDDSLMDQFLVAKYRDWLVVKNCGLLSSCHAAFEALDPRFSTKVGKMYGNDLLICDFSTLFDYVACFYVLRHAEQCCVMVIRISDCAIDDKLLKEITDILSNANGKLQVRELSLKQTKLSDKGVADLFKRASAAFTILGHLSLSKNNFTDIMSSFTHTSCTSLTRLDLSHNPLGVSGLQSLETAIQSGALMNLVYLHLSNTLTDDADVNGALLTTLLQSIASHCAKLVNLDISDNNLSLLGLCSVVENIPLGLDMIDLSVTHFTTSFHSESQYTVTCEMLTNLLTTIYLSDSNFSGTAGTLLLAKILQAYPSLEDLYCWRCSLTSTNIIMLIHHLKSANVICMNLHSLDLRNNCIDDEGVIALTECLPELFPSLESFFLNPHCYGVALHGNPVSEELIPMCNEQLKTIRESRNSAVLTEWERTCLPPQNQTMNRTFLSLWDTLLSDMADLEVISRSSAAYKPAEYYSIVYEVVDTVDTPSDVTDPDTLINEQSFSQASPVEHHPTASDEATCTALQSTHRTDQHTTDTAVLSDVIEGDTSQDVVTSFPHTIPSGAGGLRTVTIEELKECTKVTDSQLDTEIEETDMFDLADHFDNVETYPVMLGLSPAEQKDVKYALFLNDMQTAMFHTLKVWRQHNPGAATYRALVDVVLDMRMEELATYICQSAAI